MMIAPPRRRQITPEDDRLRSGGGFPAYAAVGLSRAGKRGPPMILRADRSIFYCLLRVIFAGKHRRGAFWSRTRLQQPDDYFSWIIMSPRAFDGATRAF